MTEAPQQPSSTARSLHVTEAPLDTAQQSLADALRTSFKILKLAMIVLVVVYCVSGVFTVEQNGQALVLRLGQMVGGVRGPGMHWAFPPPIDRVIEIPVRKSSTLAIDSHWLFLNDEEKKTPLSEITRGRAGLHPGRDGALLTGDKGLVHVKWRLTYGIDDLVKYVSNVADEDYTKVDSSKAEAIITKLLERAAIDVAGGFTTEETTRKRLTDLRAMVKRRVNDHLEELRTGIVVESVEIPMSTPPLQTKLAFDQVIRAENRKQTSIREAQQQAMDLLNETAGAAHVKLLDLLDRYGAAATAGDVEAMERLSADLDRVVEYEASGTVGSMIRESKGYYSSVVQSMRADAEKYETLVPEWRDRRELLITRIWEKTKQRLLSSPGITKMYRPLGAEFRIVVGLDPRQSDIEERRQYLEEGQDKKHEHRALEHKFPGGKIQ